MHIIEFIQDLAVIMMIAGIITILFHRFKQPVVLGYIIAGVIIGPYTPPFYLIHDETIIKTLAELGIVFLLFSLGLEFSFRKLLRVGSTAIIAALTEITVMTWLGYQIGIFFGWTTMEAIFLGAILSISSTTIIIKALDELKLKRERFAQLIFGILIIEDILAIGMIAVLSAIGTTGTIDVPSMLTTVGQLVLFIVVSVILGILIIPRILDYVAQYKSNEMLLITVLGICFGFCLLVLKLHYSVALGAFIIGSVIAESKQIHTIERLIEPIRDMFSAIFFVAIGLLLDPNILIQYALPITVITFFVIVGKFVSCGTGTFITGNDGHTSMRVGMGLSQIGEFSFIIASLGITLNVTGNFLYPVTVAVSAITTLCTPYLIQSADPLYNRFNKIMPERISRVFISYTEWLRNIHLQDTNLVIKKMIRRIISQVVINFMIVVALFLASAYFSQSLFTILSAWNIDMQIQRALLLGVVLIFALPFYIATYRKLQGLSMILAELAMKPSVTGRQYEKVRNTISEIIPILSIAGMVILTCMLSAGILPTIQLLIFVFCIVCLITLLLWKKFIIIHSKLQNAFRETLESKVKM